MTYRLLYLDLSCVLSSDPPPPRLRQSELIIVSMFCTAESGVVVQDWLPLSEQHSHVVGVAVPYFYLLLKLDSLILDADKVRPWRRGSNGMGDGTGWDGKRAVITELMGC